MQDRRLFAFGCSFTEYRWPTWADIWGLGGQFSGGYWNMAAKGSSNERIAYHINEFCVRFGPMLNESDIIAVMWSSLNRLCTHSEVREDGSKHPGWRSSGSCVHSDWYQDPHNSMGRMMCTDERFIMRDYNLIHFANQVMEQTPAKVRQFQMIDIQDHTDAEGTGESGAKLEYRSAMKELFGDSLSKLKPSMHENVFSGDWNSLPDHNLPDRELRIDGHPTPLEHMTYMRQVIPGEFVISPEVENEVYYINNRIISNNNSFSAEENYHKQYFTNILPLVRDYPEKFL